MSVKSCFLALLLRGSSTPWKIARNPSIFCLRTLLFVVVLTEEWHHAMEMENRNFKSEGPREWGASHFLGLGGGSMTGPPIEEVGPAHVFKAATDGEHGVGARLRPTAPRQFESVPDDAIEGVF